MRPVTCAPALAANWAGARSCSAVGVRRLRRTVHPVVRRLRVDAECRRRRTARADPGWTRECRCSGWAATPGRAGRRSSRSGRGRRDLAGPLSRPLALGIHRLTAWGILGESLTVVPAPSRRSAARRRGEDPVVRIAMAATAASPRHGVAPVLRTTAMVRDSRRADRRRP